MTSSSYNWHSMKIEDVIQTLKSSKQGLKEEEVRRRFEEFGPNELREEKKVTPLNIFLNQFKSILVIILIAAALISGFILAEYIDMYVILIIVVINVILGFVQEYRAERAVEVLKSMITPITLVMRDGRERKIPSREIVPGDVILLETGGRVPADAILFETTILKVDEAPLSGESVPIMKGLEILREDTPVNDRTNMVFMGTSVVYGRGKGFVVSTGMSTEFGKIAEMVQTIEEEAPPLKRKVERLGKNLGLISLAFCVLIFIIGYLFAYDLAFMFLTSVSMAVSAIPEGLPAVITVTLALGMSRMAREKAIVRKLAAVETLGCTTVICSDKTGTLTRNEMTVRMLYLNGETIEVTGTGYEPKGVFLKNGLQFTPQDDGHLTLLLRIGSLCNNARLEGDAGSWQIIGDSTEGAIVVAAAKGNIWQDRIQKRYQRIGEIPFDSVKKRMTTIHTTPEGKKVAYVKGAPEVVLEQCNRIYDDNSVRELNEKEKEHLLEVAQQMASQALRLLAVAYKEVPDSQQDFEPESLEYSLIFVGFLGMIDPPRKEIPQAIKLCKRAGIRSIMITGDHKLTATAVAKQIGLLESDKGAKVLTGTELDKLNDEKLDQVIDETSVYARVSPEHKVRIAQALKKRGHIVAMTGDGVNDAPAIKTADIGISMGIKGTDVTKEASDMILADDNFATIVSAVEGGRHIFENIKKYMRLMITTNFDEFFEIALMSIAGLPFTLLPIHILWVNLVTDGLPAIALSIDPKEPDLMKRPPRDPKEGLLRPMWRFVLFVAILDLVTDVIPFLFLLTGGFKYWGPWLENDPRLLLARTENFTSLVFFEIFLAYVCRSEKYHVFRLGWKGLTDNKMLFYSLLGSFALQLAIIYIPFLQTVFHTTALPPLWLAVAIIDSMCALIILPGKLLGKEVKVKDIILLAGWSIGAMLMIMGTYTWQQYTSIIFWIGLAMMGLSIIGIYDLIPKKLKKGLLNRT